MCNMFSNVDLDIYMVLAKKKEEYEQQARPWEQGQVWVLIEVVRRHSLIINVFVQANQLQQCRGVVKKLFMWSCTGCVHDMNSIGKSGCDDVMY